MLRILKTCEVEREAILKIVDDLAEYYSIKITDNQREMFADDLSELGPPLVEKAARLYRKQWNSKTFPLPAKLREQVCFFTQGIISSIPSDQINYK